jgi:hypothetical protein
MSGPLGEYAELIGGFLARGYRPVFFDGLTEPRGQLAIRHDVDFDCGLAHELSHLEDRLGVRSTYFFLLRSDSYNPFSARNASCIRSILERGHRVGIHFDPTVHDDVERGFGEEKAQFESFFGVPLTIASVHRPNDFLKDCDRPLCGVEHTYQAKYFKDIAYLSDSQGRFRFGHPFESDAWRERRTIHLLLHPIWWMFPGAPDELGLLDRFVDGRHQGFRRHVAANCVPYLKRLEP